MSIKRLSVRFNLNVESDRKAWEYLDSIATPKTRAIINAVNKCARPQEDIALIIRTTIKDCLKDVKTIEAPVQKEEPEISNAQNNLLDAMKVFL